MHGLLFLHNSRRWYLPRQVSQLQGQCDRHPDRRFNAPSGAAASRCQVDGDTLWFLRVLPSVKTDSCDKGLYRRLGISRRKEGTEQIEFVLFTLDARRLESMVFIIRPLIHRIERGAPKSREILTTTTLSYSLLLGPLHYSKLHRRSKSTATSTAFASTAYHHCTTNMPIRPVSIRSVPRGLLLPLRQPLPGGPNTPTPAKPDPIPFLQAQQASSPLPPNLRLQNWAENDRQRWSGVKSDIRDGVRTNGKKGERKWVKIGLRDMLRQR